MGSNPIPSATPDSAGQELQAIQRRALFGLTWFLGLLWLALFVPAWSLEFWEAWVFGLIFSLSVTAITLYFLQVDPELIERRLSAGPLAEKEASQKAIQSLAALSFLLLLVVPSLDQRFQWSVVPAYLVIAANVLVALGLLIVFLVFKENSFAFATVEVAKGQKVVTTGPYRLVRHPMYAGALLAMPFTPVALGSFVGLVLTVPLVGAIVWRLLAEEKFLGSHLLGYAEYCKNTRYRLIPLVW